MLRHFRVSSQICDSDGRCEWDNIWTPDARVEDAAPSIVIGCRVEPRVRGVSEDDPLKRKQQKDDGISTCHNGGDETMESRPFLNPIVHQRK